MAYPRVPPLVGGLTFCREERGLLTLESPAVPSTDFLFRQGFAKLDPHEKLAYRELQQDDERALKATKRLSKRFKRRGEVRVLIVPAGCSFVQLFKQKRTLPSNLVFNQDGIVKLELVTRLIELRNLEGVSASVPRPRVLKDDAGNHRPCIEYVISVEGRK